MPLAPEIGLPPPSVWLIVVPLLALLAAVPLGRRAARLMPTLAVVMPALALWLIVEVSLGGRQEHTLGGWPPPLGIALRADGLSAAMLLLAALLGAAAGLFSIALYPPSGNAENAASGTFWPLFFSLWAAMNVVFLSGDLFNLYVALELLTIASVGLAALGSLAAAMRYMVFALFGSLAYLLGVVLLYARWGTLDLDLLGTMIEAESATILAAGLMTAGLLVKAALFPLHGWLPPAHGSAPPPASAVLSGLVVKAAFYILVRLWFDLLPPLATEAFVQATGALGSLAILVGSVMAIRAERLKLVIAYSTVAQLGYLFLIWPLAGGAMGEMPWAAGAWTGGIFHAIAHGLAKAAMFLAAGLMMEALGHDRLDGLAGLARALPFTTFSFGLAAVSLMGLPPSGGFIAKWLMLTAAFAADELVWAGAILAGGLLAAIYLFRPLSRMLDKADPPELNPIARRREILPMSLAALAVLMGVAPGGLYALLQIGRPEAALEGLE
jgi:formate hydrogenlyase subunit 3/multisubunit Na+/H+ antiporter MnhD subunit